MSAEFHQRLRKLFDEVVDLSETQRRSYLDQACANDPALLEAVTRLLDAHRSSESFLEETSQHIGRYRIVKQLGAGAMGVVYHAIDPLLGGRSVALKVIHSDAAGNAAETVRMRDALFREARSAGMLTHPNIVTIYDMGTHGDTPFIAMELVDGPSLMQMLETRSTMDRIAAIQILKQTAQALDFAHLNGVIHRDIKPGNILVQKGNLAKITDFGIAKVQNVDKTTATGSVMGTPGYMAPEQIVGRPLDGRADQFALAAVAFRTLTGLKAFPADTMAAGLQKILFGKRPSAWQSNPLLPPAVDTVFYRALAKEAQDRYPSCADFVVSLEGSLTTSSAPAPKIFSVPAPAPPVAVPLPRRAPEPVRIPAPFRVEEHHRHWPLRYTVIGVGAGALVVAALLFQFLPPMPQAASPPAVVNATALQFAADPTSIESGAAATLKWDIPDGTSVAIDHGIGPVSPKGELNVTPTASTTYVMTAKTPKGEANARASVAVVPAVPVKVIAFRADPATVPPGGSFELIWNVSGADRVSIDNGMGDVDLSASRTLTATSTTQFTLIATSSNKQVSAYATVIVSKAPAPPPSVSAAQNYADATAAWRARDSRKAIDLFRKAAEQGDLRSMKKLGEIYHLGDGGIAKNDQEAARWYQRAANTGDLGSMYSLGQIDAVLQAYGDAITWWTKAAAGGHVAAMYDLGTLYENGKGVPKNPKAALDLYRKAAVGGEPRAKKRVALLGKQR